MGGSSPQSLVDEATPTGPMPRWSLARVLGYLLVIGIGLVGGMVLAIVAGLSMGWINFQC
jgi:hypothetical protein